jgi:hypothetical protein
MRKSWRARAAASVPAAPAACRPAREFKTEDYMRAVFATHPGVTPELVDERTAGRLARQGVLTRESPPRLWCILDQFVLKREIGSRKTMAGQVRHLIDMGRRPNVTVQVITDTARCGLSGAF